MSSEPTLDWWQIPRARQPITPGAKAARLELHRRASRAAAARPPAATPANRLDRFNPEGAMGLDEALRPAREHLELRVRLERRGISTTPDDSWADIGFYRHHASGKWATPE